MLDVDFHKFRLLYAYEKNKQEKLFYAYKQEVVDYIVSNSVEVG